MKQKIPKNFIYPEILLAHYRFGSSPLTGEPLREDADWRDYLPPEEDQNKRGIESSACYIEAQQHTIATIEEETFGETDNNYSSRFNAFCSGGTSQGGDPLKGADSIRHDGMIPESIMPFGDDIQSWNDFHSFKGVRETDARAKGKEYLTTKELGFDIVCQREESIEAKYVKMRQALKYSPLPVSVCAWFERNGMYYKPEGMTDTHLVEAVYLDAQNRLHIRDTYAPYFKILEPNTDVDFAMRWTVQKREDYVKEKVGFIQFLINLFTRFPLVELVFRQKTQSTIPAETTPISENIAPTEPPKETPDKLTVFCEAIKEWEDWVLPGGRTRSGILMPEGSASFRNRNAGNLKWANQKGAIGKDKQNHAIFATEQDGWNALVNQVKIGCTGKSSVYFPTDTILDFFKKYAEANSTLYAQFVGRKLGVDYQTFQIKNLL